MPENQADTIPSPTPAASATPAWASAAPATAPVPVEHADFGASGDHEHGPQNPRDLRERLRQPAVAAVVGGVLLLSVGFGTGFVVGRDQGSATGTTQQGGPGAGFPGGFGRQGQTGQGQTGQQFGPGQVAPGQVAPGQVAPGQVAPGQVAPGQVAPGTGGSTGTT